MRKVKLSLGMINKFERYLRDEERSQSTLEKYMRDVRVFYEYLPEDKEITKEILVSFKQNLTEQQYKTTTINSMLVAINGLLQFLNATSLKVKLFKIQKKAFYDEGKEMTKGEYKRLLSCAKENGDKRMFVLMQTICGTGIRVSEHKFITVEALIVGKATVNNKGKERVILISKELRKTLLDYCRELGIESGPIFITKYGNPMDRSNIWSAMKELCEQARVEADKVFPHNLRHLFALTYYRLKKDLAGLADLLGHTSIETTRGYTKTDGREYRKSLSRLELVSLEY